MGSTAELICAVLEGRIVLRVCRAAQHGLDVLKRNGFSGITVSQSMQELGYYFITSVFSKLNNHWKRFFINTVQLVLLSEVYFQETLT